MELLDRYLQAVKKHLPWERQEDIIAELRANLEEQLEEKEAGLGRALSSAEMEAWLKKMGAPFQMAARYFPQQYLIGPALFRLYWLVLRLAVSWAVIISLVVGGVTLIAGHSNPGAVVDALLRIPGVILMVAAWVTLIFAAMEFGVTHYPSKLQALTGDTFDWSSAALPRVESRSSTGKPARSYVNAIVEVVFGFVFLIWLLLIPKHPFLLMGPGIYALRSSPFQLAPIWYSFYWWMVALNVLQLGWRLVDLIRGSWRAPSRAQHLVVKAFGLIPLGLLVFVRDQAYLVVRGSLADRPYYGLALASINHAIYLGFVVVSAIVVVQLAWDIAKSGRGIFRGRMAGNL